MTGSKTITLFAENQVEQIQRANRAMATNQLAAGDKDVETTLKAQAKVRVKVGLPVIAIMFLSAWHWNSSSNFRGLAAAGIVGSAHCLYVFTAQFFSNRLRPFTVPQLIIATAILDPLMLSAWLAIINEAGSLFICFYLFTILGFGFRMGPKPMLICQLGSIFGFCIVVLVAPIWEQHPLFAGSFISLLIVVPLYARVLVTKLHDARAHAEFESSAKSELLAKVSHELRTPIMGIMASAELLAAETVEKRTVRRANTILTLARELIVEINDLLDTAKFKANALVLDKSLFDLHDVMDQLQMTLASAAGAKGISLVIETDDGIVDLIQGDAHYLNKILTNIAGNAVKFTESGSVVIQCRLIEQGDDFYRIKFSVQDTGIGIPEELHEKIFEPFVQASSGTTRQYGGTGLGMSIAKELVTLMGGQIYLDSSPGKGSHFYFDLQFPKVVKERHSNDQLIETPLAVYGKRILVADDNRTNLILIKELLEIDQHEVVTADSGQQALDILNNQEFDLIFLDYNMGDIDGTKVLQFYQLSHIDASPTYFLTADITSSTAAKLLDTGAVGVLHKPITLDGLRKTLVQTFPADATAARVKPTLKAVIPVASIYLDASIIEELKSFKTRPDFLSDLIGQAIENILGLSQEFTDAIQREDIDGLRDKAHALAGVGSAVGAVRLSSFSRKMMRMTVADLKANGSQSINDLRDVLDPTIDALREVLEEMPC
jgi:two-component system sensor histidine kinase RpfC